ncbi:ABC transporter substrate-binding protein [Methylococcus sp. ANG]|uniref:ABC transporter substrate-binding protein n=1 Tax=unclassified Methylococcus TaxID=2618889 RepID=UPI001C52A26C|nr:ABC transporter substrate-binding protein [Methylococcus sp. Mc7]QXP83462.1 ABC transporter substrate-binding protein [Methylococcus sp. Mc7]
MKKLVVSGAALAVLAALAGAWGLREHARPPIRIGILHSLTGAMAISEKSAVDAELMAIDEINAAGGLLGRRVEAVVADGASDWGTFARQAGRLITEEKVSAIIGCWTSACRKNVKPVVEKYNHLLIYPMAYEGLEISKNIIYTGLAPNQQIVPALKWSLDKLGRRVFLVGSDYVWPHSVNAVLRDWIKGLDGEIVGEEYVFFGSSDVGSVVEKIAALRPNVVISTIAGESNLAFYRVLRESGIQAKDVPVVSLSVGEEELRDIPPRDAAGHYSAWGYFQAVAREENTSFVRRFRERYGQDRVTADFPETAYFSMLLWAEAVREAGSPEAGLVNEYMLGQSIDAPEGVVTIDPATRHTWRSFNMGRILDNGQVEIVWSTDHPIRPVPYPRTRSRREWENFLNELYIGWNHNWANPVPTVATVERKDKRQ